MAQLSRLFSEKYELGRPLGHGGMGAVHLARDRRSGQEVAIKFLNRPESPTELARFLREGAVLSDLRHPNVVRVLEVSDESGHPWISCEYVAGGSLRERLRAQARLPLHAALSIVLDVLAGLEACHNQGIVHRDLKPENILLPGGDHAKVADFGIAKVFGDPGSSITQTGIVVGTPLYMSPEQLRGERVSTASDLYSLGVVLFEIVAGRHPFAGATLASLPRIQEEAEGWAWSTMVPQAPGTLVVLLSRMLSPRVGNRPSSAADLSARLRAILREHAGALPVAQAEATPARSDEELMVAVARGELDALGVLVERHQRRAWQIAFRSLSDPTEAEDIVQTAFLKILAAAATYRPTAQFTTYLARVVTRLCLDLVEKRAPVYMAQVPLVVDQAETPGTATCHRAACSEVRLALLALPVSQRVAVVLRYHEGASLREIGEALSVTPKAAERLLDRARKTLAARLDSLIR